MPFQPYKMAFLLAGAILIQALSLKSQSRLFHYGPNPIHSMYTFPQDGIDLKIKGSYFKLNHETRGWFGNLDEPSRRPEENDATSSRSMKLTDPDIDFNTTGYSSIYALEILPIFISTSKYHLQTCLAYQLQQFSLKASGSDSWKNEQNESSIYPFQARVERANSQYSLGGAIATFIAQYLLGLRFSFTYEKIRKPRGELKMELEPFAQNSNLLTWGWTVNRNIGDNLLGKEAHIDGFEQNSFYTADSWETNTIIGVTVKRRKLALQWRHRIDHFEFFEYDFNFDGYFPEEKELNQRMTDTWRVNSISQVMHTHFGKVSILGSLEYRRRASRYVGQDEADFKSRYIQHALSLETGPVIFTPYKHAHVTSGLFLAGGLSNFKHRNIFGNTELFQGGTFRDGWPDRTDRPSYGNAPFIGYSIETNIEIPIARKPELRIRAELWQQHRRTYSVLHYGKNEEANESPQYVETAERKTVNCETWVGGQLGLWYHFGSYFGGLFFDMPINYRKTTQTELSQKDVGLTFKGCQDYGSTDSQPMQIKLLFGTRW